ncbi:hypothetical protein KP79_PYT23213 [Mizuhopecten yessoensis]|uniref:Uncharacterized protein n=1 Tax=Mizuhopecten yessoensis TaxID=6573 RepID=A0A210QMM0_MIZYE|nr:hypothetical protein KP79_PYT23213 [Mizuhopecten yessoensis]
MGDNPNAMTSFPIESFTGKGLILPPNIVVTVPMHRKYGSARLTSLSRHVLASVFLSVVT